jgi:hypothetical protein
MIGHDYDALEIAAHDYTGTWPEPCAYCGIVPPLPPAAPEVRQFAEVRDLGDDLTHAPADSGQPVARAEFANGAHVELWPPYTDLRDKNPKTRQTVTATDADGIRRSVTDHVDAARSHYLAIRSRLEAEAIDDAS